MEASTTMDIQKRLAARQIQPIGFSGRLEAIRAPTRGKARKGKKITSELRAPAVPQVLAVEGCGAAPTYKDDTVSAAPTTNMATERAASDHASQVLPSIPLFRCLTPAVTTLLYSTTVSQTLRWPLQAKRSLPNLRVPPRGGVQATFPVRNMIGFDAPSEMHAAPVSSR
jgi:hypothetical protein